MLRQFRVHAIGCELGDEAQRVRIRGGEGACGDLAEAAEDDPLSRRRRVHDLGRGDKEVAKTVSAGDVVRCVADAISSLSIYTAAQPRPSLRAKRSNLDCSVASLLAMTRP